MHTGSVLSVRHSSPRVHCRGPTVDGSMHRILSRVHCLEITASGSLPRAFCHVLSVAGSLPRALHCLRLTASAAAEVPSLRDGLAAGATLQDGFASGAIPAGWACITCLISVGWTCANCSSPQDGRDSGCHPHGMDLGQLPSQ